MDCSLVGSTRIPLPFPADKQGQSLQPIVRSSGLSVRVRQCWVGVPLSQDFLDVLLQSATRHGKTASFSQRPEFEVPSAIVVPPGCAAGLYTRRMSTKFG